MALKDKILDRAQKYMLKGNIDKALAEYRSAIDIDPRDISIRLRIGDLYVKTDSMPEAIKAYTEAARANAQRGFYPKAIAVYKKVLKLDDTILDVHYKLAELYTKQRLIADAISSYSYIVSTFEKKGKTSEVMELLKKMLDIDPENVGIRLKLADLFLKLSFEKDAVTEYAQIFAKLIADGKVDRAEKVFLSLFNARPNEPVILHALAEIYRKKGDEVKFLNYARPLLKTYTKNEDAGKALELSKAILAVRPDDAAALDVMRGIEPPELIHHEPAEAPASESPVPAAPGQVKPSEGDFSIAASKVTDGPPVVDSGVDILEEDVEESGVADEAGDGPLISWPEEDIEISVEGFDEEQPAPVEPVEDAFKEEEEFAVTGSEVPEPEEFVVEEPVVEEPVAEEPEPVEEPAIEAQTPVEAAAEEAIESVEGQAPEEVPVEESPAYEPIQVEEPAPAVEAVSNEQEDEVEVEIDLGDYGIDRTVAPVSFEVAAQEPLEIEESPVEDIEEPVAEEPVFEEPFHAEEPAPVEEPVVEQEAPAGAAADEPLEPLEIEESLVEDIEEPVAEEPAPVEEPVAEEPSPVEEPLETIEVEETLEEAIERVLADEPFVVDSEEVPSRGMETAPLDETPAAIEDIGTPAEPPAPEVDESSADSLESIDIEDELSSAIEELQARMESDAMLLEPEKVKIEESAPESEFIDLSAELGMEEALEGLAGTWTQNEGESTDAFDEYKDGIGHQLSKEDTETHYNLGIAYMEMELFDEASKEFKIALKEPRLEGDCYARLGLCAMAESKPEEAVMFYLKGLKVEGKSEDERKGMMYELALAYEAAGDMDEALQLFTSIHDLDPDYREVEERLAGFDRNRPYLPMDDGLMEVELL